MEELTKLLEMIVNKIKKVNKRLERLEKQVNKLIKKGNNPNSNKRR